MGLIGNLAAQLFALHGCEVIGVDIVPERLEIARRCGFGPVLNSRGVSDLGSSLRDAVGGDPEIVVEATGVPQLVNEALERVCPNGDVILLGSPRGEVTLDLYKFVHRRGVRLIGAHEGMQGSHGLPSRRTVTRHMLHLLEKGSLQVDPLITHEIQPEEAAEAYNLLLSHSDQALGIILRW